MAIDEQHSDVPGSAPAAAPGQPAMSAKGAARRRFARAGVGASGVLMTLASAPGMACTTCVTTSGFHSIAIGSSLYGTAKPGIVCQGVPGSTWASMGSTKWPCSQSTTFSSIYLGSGKSYFTVPAVKDSHGNITKAAHEMTMLEACQGVADGGDGGLAKLFAAVYLNVTGTPIRTNYITMTKLKAMFTACNTNGTFKYSDSSSATWNRTEILQYMVGTV